MRDTHPSDETLSGWLGRDLPAGEQRRVAEHLRHCERCQGELQALREVVRRAQDPAKAWPEKFAVWETVAARLNSGRRLPRSGRRWRSTARVAIPIAAAAALAGILLMPPRSRERPALADHPAVAALLTLDGDLSREVEALAARPDWGTEAARYALRGANHEITGGIAELTRALRARPDDPALTQSLGRAVEHRAGLIREATR